MDEDFNLQDFMAALKPKADVNPEIVEIAEKALRDQLSKPANHMDPALISVLYTIVKGA